MNDSTSPCSKCNVRYPSEELSRKTKMCRACKMAYPFVKCHYCRCDFQVSANTMEGHVCGKCADNIKQYGKPKRCAYCQLTAAFVGSKCRRCTISEHKYGNPVQCEHCKQKCAFNRKDDTNASGKVLCSLCAVSYKRVLSKANKSLKHVDANANKNKTNKSNNAGSSTKTTHKHSQSQILSESDCSGGTPSKRIRIAASQPSGDRDHILQMSSLQEKVESLERVIVQKDAVILNKDKMMTELRAEKFEQEKELRRELETSTRLYDKEREDLRLKIKSLYTELATHKKTITKLNSTKDNNNGGSNKD